MHWHTPPLYSSVNGIQWAKNSAAEEHVAENRWKYDTSSGTKVYAICNHGWGDSDIFAFQNLKTSFKRSSSSPSADIIAPGLFYQGQWSFEQRGQHQFFRVFANVTMDVVSVVAAILMDNVLRWYAMNIPCTNILPYCQWQQMWNNEWTWMQTWYCKTKVLCRGAARCAITTWAMSMGT